MRLQARATVIVALVLVLAFVAAGCGGDDDDSVATPAGTTATTAETASPSDSGDDAASSGAGVFGTAECRETALAMGRAMAGAGGSDASGDLGAGFASTAKALEAAKKAAPDEVDGALDTLAEAFDKVADKLKGVDYTPGKGAPPQEWIDAFSVFQDAKYESASKSVSDWFESNCGS